MQIQIDNIGTVFLQVTFQFWAKCSSKNNALGETLWFQTTPIINIFPKNNTYSDFEFSKDSLPHQCSLNMDPHIQCFSNYNILFKRMPPTKILNFKGPTIFFFDNPHIILSLIESNYALIATDSDFSSILIGASHHLHDSGLISISNS